MSIFLTNPQNNTIDRGGIPKWPHKDATAAELENMGVPMRVAELAMIDFRNAIYTCQKHKLTPIQSAKMIFEIIEPRYKIEGRWLHEN